MIRFVIHPHDSQWLVDLPSQHGGGVAMIAEGLSLKGVNFGPGVLYASIRAAWGVSDLDDNAAGSLQLLRDLGIGRPFRIRGAIRFYREDDAFVCDETHTRLRYVKRALLIRSNMFYSNDC